jgi:hypothetical protein
MSDRGQVRRDAITRARFFLEQARGLPYRADFSEYEPFEAYLEAAIIYSRVAISRLHTAAEQRAKGDPHLKAEVDAWWASLLEDPAIPFIRDERNFIAHEGPPKFNQNIMMGGPAPGQKMEELYYYETPDIPATETIERHLRSVERIVTDAEEQFGTATLLGLWEG